MTDVVSELDARFSDPDASATSWDDARQVLEAADITWITTVRTDGRPHVTPLVAVRPTKILAFGKGTFSHTRHRL